MLKLVIWPAGRRTQRLIEKGFFNDCEIVGIVDSYKTQMDTPQYISGYCIHSPADVPALLEQADCLLITAIEFEDIYLSCMELQLDPKKICIFEQIDSLIFKHNNELVKKISARYNEITKLRQYQLTLKNEKDSDDSKRLVGKGKYACWEYRTDYSRYRGFEFTAEKILEEKIEGDIAEFGVFRGLFSSLILDKLPGRRMFWFDTFTGFSEDEAVKESALGRCPEGFAEAHARTSLDIALSNVQHTENVIVCQGLFPASITPEAEAARFAFVSIDVDFEDSTYEGLKFFYPRLVDGGYIFLHDYNSNFLGGVRTAVKRYQQDSGVRLMAFPMADRAGTLVITR